VANPDVEAPPAILVVGGELRFRDRLRMQLQNRGLRVFEALSGAAATVAVRVVAPACLIVMGPLPDVEPVAWLRTRREAGDATRVVLVSSSADLTTTWPAARELNLEMVVPGDLDAATLAHRVEAALAHGANGHALGSPPRTRPDARRLATGSRAMLATAPAVLRSFDEADDEAWTVHAVDEVRFLGADPLELGELRALRAK
jgi:DNA-binding response OmpR family regulator